MTTDKELIKARKEILKHARKVGGLADKLEGVEVGERKFSGVMEKIGMASTDLETALGRFEELTMELADKEESK